MKRNTYALIGIIALSLIYHLVTIDRQSFFVDETFEVAHARDSIAEIVQKPDSTPPGYALALKAWLGVLQTDAAARYFSVACSVIAICVVYQLGRKAVDTRVGLLTAGIFAALPLQLYYAQFVRSYELFILLVAMALTCYLYAVKETVNPRRWGYWSGFVLCSVAGMFTHYFFSVFLATLLLVTFGLLARTYRTRPELVKQTAIAFALIAFFASPVLLLLKEDLASQKSLDNYRPFNVQAVGYTGLSFFSGYSLGPSKVELHTMRGAEATRSALPWAGAVLLLSLPLVVSGFRSLQQRQLGFATLVLLILPMGMIGLIGQLVGLTYHPRFIAWCVVPLSLLLAAGVATLWELRNTRVLSAICCCGLAVIAACAIGNRNLIARYQNEDLRSAALFLEEQRSDTKEKQTCYVLSDYLAHTLRYYSQGENAFIKLPNPEGSGEAVRDRSDLETAVAVIAEQPMTSELFWLLYSRPFHGDPNGLLLNELKTNHQLEPAAEFAGATLYRGMVPAQKNADE